MGQRLPLNTTRIRNYERYVIIFQFVFTLHCERVVLLRLSLAVLGHAGVRPGVRQSERSQLQPVPSDGPLPLQTALWTTNALTYYKNLLK